jgi:purine-binding chemotaxis protein CheW
MTSSKTEKHVMNDNRDIDRAILLKRARELAKPIEGQETEEDKPALLEFSTMGQRYAVKLSQVTAVLRILEITAIPLVPKHIPGIIRRRGESIALINLTYFFNADQTGISDADYAVVVRGAGKQFALQVDDVLGVILVPVESLKPPQDNFDPAQQPFISGVTLDGLMLLDLDSLVKARGFVSEKSAN